MTTQETANAIEARFRQFLCDILESRAEGQIDKEKLNEWLDRHVSGTLPTIAQVFNSFPLPVIEVERLTLESLFDSTQPDELDKYQITEAIAKLHVAKLDRDLDTDERALLEGLNQAEQMCAYGGMMVPKDRADDWLNDALGSYSIPEWVNENLDWDEVYESVKRNAESVQLGEHLYLCLDNT